MKRKFCACGRPIYDISGRCATCLEQRRAARAEVPAKVVRIELPDEGRHPKHLGWIRLQPCVAGGTACGPSQATHVRLNTGGGMGLKPDDGFCIPLCWKHHQEQHQIGHRAFDQKYELDSRAIAERMATESPYLERHSDLPLIPDDV